jgi:hypothetical protein
MIVSKSHNVTTGASYLQPDNRSVLSQKSLWSQVIGTGVPEYRGGIRFCTISMRQCPSKNRLIPDDLSRRERV